MAKKSNLLEGQIQFKPFHYPWAYEAWEQQQRIHWLPEEVPLGEDTKDWANRLSPEEKNLLTQIFRFFTQADVEVNDCYMTKYAQIFKPTEVRMMLAAFSNMETIHIAAYALLLDTVGMPEAEYGAFLEYEEMKNKADYLHTFDVKDKDGALDRRGIAKTLAAFSAFTEGVQLFSSFIILLNFTRVGKMKGMGQIVTWSVRDESLHCESMIKLFRTFIKENRDIWDDELKGEIYTIATNIVELEDKFIDLAFEQGGIEGLEAEEVKQYIRYICDRRLIELGMKSIFHVRTNPLEWVDYILNGIEHSNFFESRSTEYSKAASKGTWEEAFEIHNMEI
jgi:ribonucleoside-diphosphate reductase beta chain